MRLGDHRIVVSGKHGVVARSNISTTRAVDRIEYAETATRYGTWTWPMAAEAKG